MKKSDIAMLYSILFYPGAGHMVLKKYVVGSVLIVTTTAALAALIYAITIKVLQIRDIMRASNIEASAESIWSVFIQHQTFEETKIAIILFVVITVIWLIGIFDISRRG